MKDNFIIWFDIFMVVFLIAINIIWFIGMFGIALIGLKYLFG